MVLWLGMAALWQTRPVHADPASTDSSTANGEPLSLDLPVDAPPIAATVPPPPPALAGQPAPTQPQPTAGTDAPPPAVTPPAPAISSVSAPSVSTTSTAIVIKAADAPAPASSTPASPVQAATTPAVSTAAAPQGSSVAGGQTAPAQAPVASTIAASGIQVQSLAAPNPDSIGVLTADSGGFESSIWKGSSYAAIAALMTELPDAYISPTLRGLARRLLLTTADAPASATKSDRTLNSLRLAALARMGDWQDADAFAAVAAHSSIDDDAATALAQANLLADGGKSADKLCAESANEQLMAKAAFWEELSVFCKAKSGDQVGATLALELMRDQAGHDTPFAVLASYALGETESPDKKEITSIDAPGLALLAQTGKLNLSVFSAIETPEAKAFAAQTDGGHSAEGLKIGEEAARMGLLDGHQLAGLYSHGPEIKPDSASLSTASARAALYRAAATENDPARKIQAIASLIRNIAVYDGGDLTGTAGEIIADMAGSLSPGLATASADAAAIALVYLARQMPEAARPWLQAANLAAKDGDRVALEALRPLVMLDGLTDTLPQAAPSTVQSTDPATVARLQRQADAFALLGLLNAQGAPEMLTATLSRLTFNDAAYVPALTTWHSSALASAITRQTKGEAILTLLASPEPATSTAGHAIWTADTARALMALDMRNEARAIVASALVGIAEINLTATP